MTYFQNNCNKKTFDNIVSLLVIQALELYWRKLFTTSAFVLRNLKFEVHLIQCLENIYCFLLYQNLSGIRF